MATILVVDDEPDLRELMLLVLEHEHTVRLCSGGAAALEAVNDEAPDLVVLDLMMPEVDGWAVLTELKKHPDPAVRTVPVVMLTAIDELQAQARGGIEGAVQWLTKPFKIEELHAAVRQALDEPEPAQRRRAQRRALEQIARLERDGDAATESHDPPERGPRLTALERPHVSPARHRRDTVFGALDRLTDTQRRTVEAVAVQPVSEAAAALGVSRSSIYATLRRCARRLGVDSVSELLDAIRPLPQDRPKPRRD